MANSRDLAEQRLRHNKVAGRHGIGRRLIRMLSRTLRRALPLTGLTILLVLASVVCWRTWIAPIATVESLRQQLDRSAHFVSAEAVAGTMEQLAKLGDDGITVVVESLSSTRHAVRQAAAESLNRQLDSWHRLQANEHERRLNYLAGALALQAKQMPADSLRAAEQLAERLLVQPANNGTARSNRWQLCQQVLTITREGREVRPSSIADFRPTNGDDARLSRWSQDSRMSAVPLGFNVSSTEPLTTSSNYRLAGSGFVARPVGTPPSSIIENSTLAIPLPVSNATEAKQVSLTVSNGPATLGIQSRIQTDGIDRVGPDRLNNSPSQIIAMSDQALSSEPRASGRQSGKPSPPDSLRRLLDLADRLDTSNRETVAAARKQLQHEDLTESHLKLARGLVSSDPAIRQEAVTALPYIVGLPSASWLLWLSHDEDAKVRFSSLTLLATSNDPAAKKRLLEAATYDSDDAIRALGAQAAGNRDRQ